MTNSAGIVIGIDVGGTFTDIVKVDEATSEVQIAKVPSTRGDEASGFLRGITTVVDDVSSVSAIVHGTTVGTNAILERKGAVTGIITTAGFRDVLEMRRRDRPSTWGLWGQFVPIIDRDRRFEVPERTGADGSIVEAVDLSAVRQRAAELLDAGATACCVSFINAHANADNERAAVAAVRTMWPNAHVTSAVELLSEIREFERTSTAALNAYLQPVIGDYLEHLELSLGEHGFNGSFLIVQSNGGVMTSTAARALPVRTALSGPAAGVIAAAHLAGAAGHHNVITCDMGGTSFDVAVIANGATVTSAQTSVDFGLVVRTPMIEISTIGAGGGSIASVDEGGILRIGPESAGSVPGPACYGRGNDRPTVTDAHLVLGRLNGDVPIGGLECLDQDAAVDAIDRYVGHPLDLDTDEAAAAVLRVATSRMAGAIRLVSVQRGHDPSEFIAMPFGGAGALHVCGLLADIGLSAALIPKYPGVISAFGATIADTRHDLVQTVGQTVAALSGDDLAAKLAAAEEELRAFVSDADLVFDGIAVRHELDMSYVGQTHTVVVPLDDVDQIDSTSVLHAFDTAYRATYGRTLDSIAARVMSARSIIVGRRPKLQLNSSARETHSGTRSAAVRREVYFDGTWTSTPVLQRLDLPTGWTAEGPVILEQSDATIAIEPGFRAAIDDHGNVMVTTT